MALFRLTSCARNLLVACAMLAAAAPAALADDEDPSGFPSIGLLSWSSCASSESANPGPEWAPFLEGLQELGYKPGVNVQIECRSANENPELLESAAAELVEIPVDLIVSTTTLAAAAVRRATRSIPHVGIDESLFGNAFWDSKTNFTGLINYWIDLTGKRLEILKEAVPGLKKVGVLSMQRGIYKSYESRTKRAAKDLQLELAFYRVATPASLEDAFSEMKAQHVQAVTLLPDIGFDAEATQIAGLAIKYKLPIMAWDTSFAHKGFLLAYSSNSYEQRKRLAFYVDKVLNGASPQQLPIEQPSTFLLSVNLQTAHAIGATLPRSIMLMAEDVIE